MLDVNVLTRLCLARDRLREPDAPAVPEIAAEAGMSAFHFIRLYKTVFGQTPYQCKLDAKLARAKVLLTLTDRSVRSISLELGFASLGSFSYLFSRRAGQSPLAYRRRVKSLVRVPGKMPGELVPGCISLMTAAAQKLGNFRETTGA